jgi:YidC/Oxa1 family membrane protein insertase
MFLTAQGGVLGPFAWLLGKLLDLIYNILAGSDGIANLGLCIILFTIVVKLILFPLSFKQQKSTKINMVIQPELQKIQKKYNGKKDEKSMMMQQQETKELYDKYGTSMTGGCLTTFIQLPIIYALYRVIQNVPAYVSQVKDMYSPIAESVIAAQGSKAQQFLIDFVSDNSVSGASYAISKFQKLTEVGVDNVIDVLSKFGVSHLNTLMDTLGVTDSAVVGNVDKIEKIHSFAFGINISEAPGWHIGWALLIPISSALFQWLSMKVSMSKQQQQSQGADMSTSMMKSMSITMPLMSLFVCVSLPAAIGIYWSISALITMLTQLIINWYYDHADMDAILEKQMEKARLKKEKNGGKKSFYEKLMDQSEAMQEELEKQEAMKNNSAKSLKSYVPSEAAQKAVKNKENKQYKAGSIGAKANIMMNYNNVNSDKKEE